MRQVLLWFGVELVVGGCAGDGTGPPPPPAPATTLSVTLSASGNGQSGEIMTTLPLPLRVVVDSAGTKKAGVHVNWRASGGTLDPESGVTDAAGIATTTWSFDTVAGAFSATATAVGLRDTVTFAAIARASGPGVSVRKVLSSGDNETAGVNAAFFLHDLGVSVDDRYGNRVPGQVTWTIENGPVTFIDPASGPTDASGFSRVRLRPTGTQGAALVRASLPGTTSSVDYNLVIGPPEYLVLLRSSRFISVQNSSAIPAVDTISVGQTVTWVLDFDYDLHRVVSVGTPSFPPPADFPAGWEPRVSVTFTVPGKYQYADFYNSAATGVIVVR